MTETVEQETVMLCGGPADGKRIALQSKFWTKLKIPVLRDKGVGPGMYGWLSCQQDEVTYVKPYPNAVVMYPEGW